MSETTRPAPAPRRPFGDPAPAYVRGVLELYDAFWSFLDDNRYAVTVTSREYRAGWRSLIWPLRVVIVDMASDADDFRVNVAFFAAASAAGLLWVDGVRVLPPETAGKAVARG